MRYVAGHQSRSVCDGNRCSQLFHKWNPDGACDTVVFIQWPKWSLLWSVV